MNVPFADVQPLPRTLFPPLEPRRTEWLAVNGGHEIHVEESGHPDGLPVVFLHGGPGSQVKPDHRRYFDPALWRIVLFDQRGCGRSRPLGGTEANTTAHLLDDMETLRRHLGVERWVVFGGSWGSTLGLAYAQAHPDRVLGMVLRGIFTASRSELDWYFTGLRQFLPEAWARLHAEDEGVAWPELVARFRQRLHHPDAALARAAAARWNAYEAAIMAIGDQSLPATASVDDAALARARVQVHYLAQGCFLTDRQLLDNVARIAHLPALLLHGRQDFVCPPVTAWELASRWPAAELRFVETARHASSHPDLEQALVAAAGRMAARLGAVGAGTPA